MRVEPSWLTIFLDAPRAADAAARDFWQRVTGYVLSPARGEHAEFATLLPPVGDAHLRLQRRDAGGFGVHLDLHVADVDAAVRHAVALGAQTVARPGHAIMRSPAGFVFCLVPSHGETTPAPPGRWGGHRSRVDQLTIDVSHDTWDREQAFWSDLTGWPVTRLGRREFARLNTPAPLPVRVLLQRREQGATSSHPDIATDDRSAEVERITGLGATLVEQGPAWTVLAGPDGSVFCVTDRDPDTGLSR